MTEFFLELIALGLVKFPAFYGIQIFMTAPTRPTAGTLSDGFTNEFSRFSYNSIPFPEIHFYLSARPVLDVQVIPYIL
jgi:hypothetical protein